MFVNWLINKMRSFHFSVSHARSEFGFGKWMHVALED
jgi:hypothetical protein